MNYRRIYELHKGNEVVAEGTIYQIAKELGIAPSRVMDYGSRAYQKTTTDAKPFELKFLREE
ncbi:hypothetical protein BG261_02940 [Floricoccus tropicus]|uniref:Uncharacterized protein n=1 Tax=Floricoccus tropicus TaxID=1859473 RepID=A0A1E8GMS3_9LACT|nr:hypothetical protein [Floricoccus tropicus]OFI49551.1 hypothetical protein BG261_02940 [Floricoccus tropicus]